MSNHMFDKAAWAALDRFNQMGNIGSEVGRAFAAKRQGKEARAAAAFRRGLDLIDETARLWATKKEPGLKELLYARELFAESVTTGKLEPFLEDYFMQFAVAARMRSVA